MQQEPIKISIPPIYTVYDHPKDFPNHWVLRKWDGFSPEDYQLADSLEGIRALVPPGLVRLERHPTDDPVIVETWL